ncbi:MAG: hypothetical protein IJU51_02565 [Clostridia bacterium]|nr:hypothetical protein [Clostridia bacterium]
MVMMLSLNVSAKSQNELLDAQAAGSGAESLYSGLPENTKKALSGMGITSVNAESLASLQTGRVLSGIFGMLNEAGKTPLCGIGICFGIILLCSITEGFRISSAGGSMSAVQNTVAAVCISAAVIVPLGTTIERAAGVLTGASGFMLLYAPVMAGLLISSGRQSTASGYYFSMLTAGNAVSLVASRLVVPLMNVFLALSVSSAVSPKMKLGSMCESVYKIAKWLLTFVMSVFLAVMSVNTIVTSSMDKVSSRALKFTVSSFAPVVGSALSEAFTTFSGSLELLRSGAGVFVIIASSAIILPVLLECIIWQLSLFLMSSVSDIAGLDMISSAFRSVSKAAAMLTALLLSVLTVFIISTAIVLLIGKG